MIDPHILTLDASSILRPPRCVIPPDLLGLKSVDLMAEGFLL